MASVLDNKCACVDTDFLIHVSETKCAPGETLKYLAIAFQKFERFGIAHPLVYKNEMPKDRAVIAEIFKAGVIQIVQWGDIFDGDEGKERKQYYEYLVPQIFRKLTGLDFPVRDIFNDWKRQCSLGEVHSISLCLICGCDLFLSDDSDSKRIQRLIKEDFGDVCVLSREEVFDDPRLQDEIPRKFRKKLSHLPD